MNIMLIQSYVTVHNPDTALTEPLGLLSLASYLKQTLNEEININILDLFALGYDICEKREQLFVKGISRKDDVLKLIEKYRPDIVGINSNFTAYAQDSLEVARIVKEYSGQVIVVMGGAHATMDAPQILEMESSVDYIVRGEGELTFSELVSALKNGNDIEN